MIKKALLLAGILVVFPTTKAHPATDNDTTEVVYADTTGIDIDSIEASIDHIELDEVTVEASAWVWIIRKVHESGVIGVNTKLLYEIGPTKEIDGNKPYKNMGGSPWGTSIRDRLRPISITIWVIRL